MNPGQFDPATSTFNLAKPRIMSGTKNHKEETPNLNTAPLPGTSGSVIVDMHCVPPASGVPQPEFSSSLMKPCEHSLNKDRLQFFSKDSRINVHNNKNYYSESSKLLNLSNEDATEIFGLNSCQKSYENYDVDKIEQINVALLANRSNSSTKNYFDIVCDFHAQNNKESTSHMTESVIIEANDKDFKRINKPSLVKFEIFHEDEISYSEEEADTEFELPKDKFISCPDKVHNVSIRNSCTTFRFHSSDCLSLGSNPVLNSSISLGRIFAKQRERKNNKCFSSLSDGIDNIIVPSSSYFKHNRATTVKPSANHVKQYLSVPGVICRSNELDVEGHYSIDSLSNISCSACRICQIPGTESSNSLVSPCRCLGSIKYVHNNCLIKWIKMSGKRRNDYPYCEICRYQYICHNSYTKPTFSNFSQKDKFLHTIFALCVTMMVISSVPTFILFIKVNRNSFIRINSNKLPMSESDGGIIWPLLFFMSFLIAIFVEMNSKQTIYQFFSEFCNSNDKWYVEEYDPKKDLTKN